MDFKELIGKVFYIKDCDKKKPTYWTNAIAGEVGEACNITKKLERDGKYNKEDLELEFADIFNYLVLASRYFKIDLEKAILKKIKILEDKYR